MIMKTSLFRHGAFVLSLVLFASCMDNKYDLDDMDMTIGTSASLDLPISSTASIMLKNVMDLKEDGIIQIVDGEYFIKEEGSANIPRLDITPITITDPVLTNINASISLDNVLPVSDVADTRAVVYAGGTDVIDKIPNFTYTYTIQDDDGACYDLEDAVSTKVPDEVVKLTSVTFVDNTILDARIQVSFGNSPFVNLVHLDNLTIDTPKGLNVTKAVFTHWTHNGTDIVYEEVNAHKIDAENSKVILTQKDNGTAIGDKYEIHILLTFDQAVIGKGGLTFENHEVAVAGTCRVNGTFRLESDEFDKSAFTAEQLQKIALNGNYHDICPKHATFYGKADFVNDITVNSFTGSIKSSVGEISPIMLDDLPDFLNEPDVVLDLVNPVLFVEVDNPLPAEATTSITLTGIYTDNRPVMVKQTGAIVVPAERKSVICLADHFEGVKIPAIYEGSNIINVPIDKLGELLKELPNKIEVDVADINMDIDNLSIPNQYDVKVNYNIFTPLEFGSEFKLVYQATEEGLAEDLEDVDKVDVKEVRVTANVETDLPLKLHLTLDALDKSSKSLKGNLVNVSDVVIDAHNGSEAVSVHPITLSISPVEGHTISELLSKLDKFRYRAVAMAESEGKLMESAHIKIKDIKISLVGGISYDAN